MESQKLDCLIVTATSSEQTLLRDRLGGLERTTHAHRTTIFGQMFGLRVALVEASIGAVNTAQSLTAFLENHEVQTVVQTGIGGAFPGSGLGVGDLAIATEEIIGEFGVLGKDGWTGGETIGIPLLDTSPPTYNRIELDEESSADAYDAARGIANSEGRQISSGPFLTVQNVTGSAILATELEDRFGVISENMEGAAAAQVCLLYGTPFVEIRGISNIVEARNPASWDIPTATGISQSATLAYLESRS